MFMGFRFLDGKGVISACFLNSPSGSTTRGKEWGGSGPKGSYAENNALMCCFEGVGNFGDGKTSECVPDLVRSEDLRDGKIFNFRRNTKTRIKH